MNARAGAKSAPASWSRRSTSAGASRSTASSTRSASRKSAQATARLLARHYRSLPQWREEMEAAARDRDNPENPAFAHLLDVHGIGKDMAADIVGFFAEPHNREVLDDLGREVTVLDYAAPAQQIGSPLAGKTIVFTGRLEAMSRSEAKARAEALGANVASSVSAKTHYVVIGADAGSKAAQAPPRSASRPSTRPIGSPRGHRRGPRVSLIELEEERPVRGLDGFSIDPDETALPEDGPGRADAARGAGPRRARRADVAPPGARRRRRR